MSYVVYNRSDNNVSFKVMPMDKAMPMVNIASHHRRRMTKGTAFNIMIKSMRSRDLTKETGLTDADLDYCPELQNLFKVNALIRVPTEEPMQAPVQVPEEVPVQIPEEVSTDYYQVVDEAAVEVSSVLTSTDEPVMVMPMTALGQHVMTSLEEPVMTMPTILPSEDIEQELPEVAPEVSYEEAEPVKAYVGKPVKDLKKKYKSKK